MSTPYQIRKAAVLGAGVMGAAIAAHLANVGIPSLLLDIVPPDAGKDRDKIARTGLEKALKARPAAFYSQRFAKLVTTGNIEDDLPALAGVDWIIEAVVERLDIKQQLYTKLEQVMKPGAIITSNTSGLPVHLLTGGRSADFRRHFLITHFFNPVRYMRLLEIVPGVDTDPELVQYMQQFAKEVLGKGVVLCKDTPNFIANRIGVYSSMSTLHRALDEGYTVGEVDTILGPSMGRPRSAVFRTADLSGLDTLVNVADNLYQNAPGDPWRETFRVPEVVLEMVRRGWLVRQPPMRLSTLPASRHRSPIVSPAWIRQCAGASISTWGASRCGMRFCNTRPSCRKSCRTGPMPLIYQNWYGVLQPAARARFIPVRLGSVHTSISIRARTGLFPYLGVPFRWRRHRPRETSCAIMARPR